MALRRNEEITKYLILKGADLNIQNGQGETILHMVLSESEEITKYLIEKGADVNVKNRNGETVLHRAIQNNHYEIVKLLIKH